MTTSDEPPGTGEVASLEAAVRRHIAALEASPLVNGKARPLLEDVAHRCLDLPLPDALRQVARVHLLDEATQGASLHRLLMDSKVVDERGSRLVPDGVRDYLAACHRVRQRPDGPTLLHPLRKFLRPENDWPWQDSGTELFQVALWWDKAESAMRKRLTVLLSPKHRDPNVHFVAELLHRGLISADDLRDRTVEILREHLAQEDREAGRWRATVCTLDLLAPEQTADALEELAQSRSRTASSLRRFDAVGELTDRDPVRGERALRLLAESLSGDRRERLEVARMIRLRDTDLGDRAFRCLANAQDMGDLRVEAAVLMGDLVLCAELTGGERAISDPARLRLLTWLADADEAAAVAAAERFADTATLETTLVVIAKAVRNLAPDVALRIADGAAWPVRRTISEPVRLVAVHLIGELVPARRFPEFERFYREAKDEATRLKAASHIVELGGPVITLADFAADPKASRERRLLAARRVAKVDRNRGGRLLVGIAKGYKPTDLEQLSVLREAHALAPSPAANALEDIARDGRRPVSFRLRTVELGIFDKTKALGLLEHIATTTREKEGARTAARKVLGMDQDAGEKLMARLANKFTSDPAFRLSLAREAGARGKTVLYQLGLHTSAIELRLEAGTALLDVDRKLAAEVFNKIVKTRRGGEIRIRAACELPDKQALEALHHIAGDQDHEDVLFAAGVRAMEINAQRGKQILRDLAESRRVSPRTREKIRKVLAR
ncbi:hypothetical protein LFM09_42690 [Lentzea alba]|uniref:hypothetical protein n=1 Tax=Lentzea alba TaxID=2714351 RepID=UPI0039BEFB07